MALSLAAIASLSVPVSASAAEYDMFVGCDDLAFIPAPSHVCQLGDFPGAYFESDEETEYDVCVEFPSADFLCAEEQFAEAGVLYVNSITTGLAGEHFVYWFVEDTQVGIWGFRVEPPPLPPRPVPPAPAPLPATPAPTAVAVTPSPKCLKAKQRVAKLRGRLQTASERKQKSRIRAQLKAARAAARNAC